MNITKINPSIVAAALAGTIPGALLAGYSGLKKRKAWDEMQGMIGTNLVDAKDSLKKYQDVRVISSKDDIDNLDINPIHRAIIKTISPRLFEGGNAAFISAEKPVIAASPMINKHLLGHEIGHYIHSKEPKKYFQNDEAEAWVRSPFAKEPGSKKMESSALATYRYGALNRIGLALAAAGGVAAPFIMARLKK